MPYIDYDKILKGCQSKELRKIACRVNNIVESEQNSNETKNKKSHGKMISHVASTYIRNNVFNSSHVTSALPVLPFGAYFAFPQL